MAQTPFSESVNYILILVYIRLSFQACRPLDTTHRCTSQSRAGTNLAQSNLDGIHFQAEKKGTVRAPEAPLAG